MLTASILDHPAISHGFFSRRGGVSRGVFDSLNTGFGSGDDLAHVAQNRAIVAQTLGVSSTQVFTAFQHHSATAIALNAPWAQDAAPQADAIVTTLPHLPIGVLTADCAPVLLADVSARVIACAHAGWKGALGGIIEATVALMEQHGAQRENIVAAIGPCIAQENYEVGVEFSAQFLQQNPAFETFFAPSPRAPGKQHFDLPRFVQHQLHSAHIQHIERLAHDTYANEADFFSFRRATHRAETLYGRQISAITLKS